MAGALKTSATSRTNTVSLAADPDLGSGGNVATNSSFLVQVAMRVSAADGNGGLRFNLRLPTNSAFGRVWRTWQVSNVDGNLANVLSLHESGIAMNIGASPQDYFTFDLGGAAFDVVIHGTVALRTGGTAGPVNLEWCQNRLSSVATTMGIGSGLSAGAP